MRVAYLYVFLLFNMLPITAQQNNEPLSFPSLAGKCVPLRACDGKIDIPKHIKHIKLDIGLSYSAPMSQYWLCQEDDLIVFGFEPHPDCVESILAGAIKKHPSHGQPLEKKHIGNRFFLFPCALGISEESMVQFFATKQDVGCSSLFVPKYFEVAQIMEVPIFRLSDFFDIFPFDIHPVIDYIKIDAQGGDLAIVKSAGSYLADHVIYITLEAENGQYLNTHNSCDQINKYMKSIGFDSYTSGNTSDPTYVNTRFLEYLKHNKIIIYQKG